MAVLLFLNKSDENRWVVEGQHFMPFDPKHGASKERLAEGLLVDEYTPPPEVEGKFVREYIEPSTLRYYYEYADVPPQPKTIEDDVQDLKAENIRLREESASNQQSIAELTMILATLFG